MQSFEEIFSSTPFPFIGRRAELARLHSFWKGTEEQGGLRTALVVGEGGIGKSRLVGELIARIESEAGVVIHLRLYQEGRTSIAPLLQRAILSSRSAAPLVRREPDSSFGSLVATLRRLTRLRPTLLVVEDTDHMAEESLAELVRLGDALATDPLAILTLSRPVEHAGRRILERYRIEEIELQGLDAGEQAELWERLFGSPGDPGVVDALARASHGNPMALRSALRGALRAGALKMEPSSAGPLAPSGGALETIFRRSAQSVPIELTLHLTGEERRAAEQLATLGEVFSREAAEAILSGNADMICRLTFVGIVASSGPWTPPLPGAESRWPLLAFSHSLLHDHLNQTARPDIPMLASVIGRDLPLHAVTPVLLLGAAGAEAVAALPLDLLRSCIQRFLGIGTALNRGADWPNAVKVWDAAERLFRISESRWEKKEAHELLFSVLKHRIFAYQRSLYSEEYAARVACFLELTREVPTVVEAEQRLAALFYEQDLEFRRSRSPGLHVWAKVDDLVNRFPDLLFTEGYIFYLQQAGRLAWTSNSTELFQAVEQRLHDLERGPALDPATVEFARLNVGIYLLTFFRTAEDVASRLELMAWLETRAGSRLDFLTQKIELYYRTGRFREVLDLVEVVIPIQQENGLYQLSNRYRVLRFAGEFVFGGPAAGMERNIRELIEFSEVPISPHFLKFILLISTGIGLLNGELEWVARLIGELGEPAVRPLLQTRLIGALLSADEGALAGWVASIDAEERAAAGEAPMVRLTEALTEPSARLNPFPEDLRAELEREPATLIDASGLRVAIELLECARDRGLVPPAVAAGTIGVMARHLLDWLAGRGWTPALRAMLERFAGILEPQEWAGWQTRVAAMAADDHLPPQTTPTLVRISMLGTILITKPGEEPHRLRGSRLSTLLGLMVADRMLGRSLTANEFRRLVFDAADPEYGRRMLNSAVWRLREILGHEMILTDGETPRLDLDRVEVDLLVADALVARAAEGVRDDTPMRAVPSLLEALEATRGEVPFPGLYDEFFEAARDDFESRLRSAVLDVVTMLLHEGDPLRAEQVLRRALDTIPDDEDFTALLKVALVALGRRAEARLVTGGEEN